MKVKCPTCKKQSLYEEKNPFRPFCSKRCKMIDLGEWAQESYKLESKEPVSEDDLLEALKSQNS
tara:strand:+ start:10533 stop:10724 length:192 start_codon:yes stop_codon:yes gene_type:complete